MFFYSNSISLMRRTVGKTYAQLRKRHLTNSSGESPGKSVVLYGIAVANVGVYWMWSSVSDYSSLRFMTENFTCSSYGVRVKHAYHTLVTSFFSHKDPYHLLFNMLAYVSFGASTIHHLGTGRFLLLYFGGGVLSSIFHVYSDSLIPKSWPGRRLVEGPALGASGAINAVILWSICTFPRSTILIYFVPVPAALVGLGVIGWDFYNLYYGDSHVGRAAHLGGAAFGAAFYLLNRRRF